MRCPARHQLAFCSAVSLLLSVAVCVLWMRSYIVIDFLWYGHFGGDVARTGVITEPGVLRFFGAKDPRTKGADLRLAHTSWPADGSHYHGASYYRVFWDRWGFSFMLDDSPGYLRNWDFAIPHWFAAAMCAVPALTFGRAVMRRRYRYRFGLCLACGYDLRASPQRCPECGAAAVREPT